MKNIQIKKITGFIILFVLFFSFSYNITKAQTDTNIQTTKVGEKKTLDIDSDGLDDVLVEVLSIDPVTLRPVIKTTSLKPSQAGGSQFISSPFIGQYIQGMYKYAVMIITLLSVIMIIFAGVQWTISGGSPDKINSSKQIITRSITGLVIALGSYTLLRTINPDLVEFRALQVLRVAAVAVIPEDTTMPEGVPKEPPDKKLVSISNISDKIKFASQVDKRATPGAAAGLQLALANFGYGEMIISTAYRSPDSQYKLMTAKCGCKTVEEVLKDLEKKNEGNFVRMGQWSSYCSNITTCKVGYKNLTLENGQFQAPDIAHFGGKAFDISAATTGAVKPCGDISVDGAARKSAKVTNAGQYKNDWCIPKQQQLLIKAMINSGFCVGLKDGSTLREPWHFEYMEGERQENFCTNSTSDENMKKLEYLTL